MKKKTVSFLLSVLLLFGVFVMPTSADAATVDSKAGTVSVSSGRLNVRNSRSMSGSVVASLNKGSYVTLLSQSGSWWQVEYAKGKYGYCHADYITSLSGSSAKTVAIQSGSLNVRSGAGTSYSRQDSLSKGEVVVVLSTSGGWSRILYHGTKVGYVSAQYLFSGLSYPAVSLSVPSFKQTDSRWANVTIGNTGKTIGKIGCATTAVAMVESYRAGRNIYPDAMSKKLSYSSSGDLYWPSDYTAVTSGTSYLSKIYTQLKQGKTVLLGLKKSSGGQHWVVVTGYTGGNSLSAANFTVNDPGSSSRSSLQHVLNAYPIFYKYFTYN